MTSNVNRSPTSYDKYRLSRRGKKLQLSNDPRTLLALPKDISERTWAEIYQKEENELVILDVREDIFEEAMKICYENYMKRQNILFTAYCASEAWLKLINWNFYRHDPGEEPSAYPPCYIPKREESWTPDVPPDPSPKDTSCQQDLVVLEEGDREPLKRWSSSSSLDMPVVDEIPKEYWFPGKVNVYIESELSEGSTKTITYESESSTTLGNIGTESEVLEKVTTYSSGEVTVKESSMSALKTTSSVHGSLEGAGDAAGDKRPKRRITDKSKLFNGRKLFGGYKITPAYCKASRAAKYNRGNTICMFNHECVQRGGEVVGACMDGFLFGACCQLPLDSQPHFPKGPGIVMTSYLDYPDTETETDDYDEQLTAWHNSFKPVVTPGYRPSQVSSSTMKSDNLSTESHQAEIISEGLTQITNTLLSTPPKDSNYVFIKPENVYTHSTINHAVAETILFHKNGSVADDVVRPSDFNVQISSMQTKPTVPPSSTSIQSPSIIVSTHRPIYKPVFRPRPVNKTSTKQPSTENYVMVSTVTKDKTSELSSINSIIQMLNESTPSMKEDVTPSSMEFKETKSSPTPSTVSPVSYSSNFPNYYTSTGHYVTLKPSSYPSSTVVYINKHSTKKPLTSKKPYYGSIYTTSNSVSQDKRPIKPSYSSPKPSQSTSQDIEAFNRYPTNPEDFGDSVTTFSYVSSTTTSKPTSTTKRPPSTSYVTGSKPLRRPVTPPTSFLSTYDSDSFSSATPTVIVLNDLGKPETSSEETQFVEISQEPFKKPISQITVNNHIESTNNIFMGKPPDIVQKPTPKPQPPKNKPSSPTVVITPKPSPTTPFPVKISTRPSLASVPTMVPTPDYTEYPLEIQTPSDDLINFPPVRNPMLNVTGSNLNVFNTSVVTLSDNELEILHDVEFSTPSWQEDDKLNDKMNLFVSKIVGSLQGTFQELHDIVILDKKPNATIIKDKLTTAKPPKKPVPTRKPTTKKPVRITTTTKKPSKTTKRPVKLTTPAKRQTTTTAPPTTTTTTTAAPTTTTTTKKPITTTKRTKPTKKVTTTTVTTTVTEEIEEITTEANIQIDYNDKNLCGVRPLSKTGRIVGGKNARYGQWPWQVLVRESTWLGLLIKNKCGGVLISSTYVTTAAHCQPGFLSSLIAVFGETDISNDNEPLRPISRNVRRVIVHKRYNPATFENDLALLELESPVRFDAHIVPICMPQRTEDYTGRMATVTGWGRLSYEGKVPSILQEVEVPIIENQVCQEMFNTVGHAKQILTSFICAGYLNGQKDSCEGDSGGPLVTQRSNGKWELVGTVSHGVKCAAPYLPGVYMRTTYYMPWFSLNAGVKSLP